MIYMTGCGSIDSGVCLVDWWMVMVGGLVVKRECDVR